MSSTISGPYHVIKGPGFTRTKCLAALFEECTLFGRENHVLVNHMGSDIVDITSD